MYTTYVINTVFDDLQHGTLYDDFCRPWVFICNANDVQIWKVETNNPTAFEHLLDTDRSVVAYTRI